MEPQKLSNFSDPEPEIVEKQRVVKEQAAQRVNSWRVQNEMRSVFGRMIADAACRVLVSVNSMEKRV